jgi:hypothetical protein
MDACLTSVEHCSTKIKIGTCSFVGMIHHLPLILACTKGQEFLGRFVVLWKEYYISTIQITENLIVVR